MDDEHLYAQVVAELAASGPIAGLWAKAFAESGGNDGAARALYLKLRVAQLHDAEVAARRQQQAEQARQAEHAAQSAYEAKLQGMQESWDSAMKWAGAIVLAIVAVVVGSMVGIVLKGTS